MEAHLAPKQPIQVNKITSSCEICSGPHDTQYYMENPEQAFVDYASSRTDEAEGKWYTFKPEQNNLGDTYNPSWKSHPNLRWRQPQNSQNNFSNPPNRFQPNGSFLNRSFNNSPQSFNNQSNLEGLVSNFMASQDARLSKFEADFKQQQSEMTNKIDTVLKAITDRIIGSLPGDTVKNPSLMLNPNLRFDQHYHDMSQTTGKSQTGKPEEEQDEKENLENINTNPSSPLDPSVSFITEKVRNFTYVINFMIVEDISSIIVPRLSQVVLEKPFVEISNMTHDPPEGVVRFTNGTDEIAYKMPYKIEQYNSLSNLEREHTKSVYLKNEEDKRRGVEYVISKILGFYKECLELGPEYATGIADEGEVT
ncbi:hypothetical protein Tco_1232531 [Tanacetum coccineum]